MTKTIAITINKNPNLGNLPGILDLAHRQLEKTSPEPSAHLGSYLRSYRVAVDLFQLLLPNELIDDISELTLLYKLDVPNGDSH